MPELLFDGCTTIDGTVVVTCDGVEIGRVLTAPQSVALGGGAVLEVGSWGSASDVVLLRAPGAPARALHSDDVIFRGTRVARVDLAVRLRALWPECHILTDWQMGHTMQQRFRSSYAIGAAEKQMGWKVKIAGFERVEPPHATVMRGARRGWRFGLRGRDYLDKEPPSKDVPAVLTALLVEDAGVLAGVWDAIYPENPV